MGKRSEWTLFKENIQMANKHKRICSTSLVTRVMQIKTAMRHHLTPATMTKIKKIDSNKYWWIVEKLKLSYHADGNVNICSYFGK